MPGEYLPPVVTRLTGDIDDLIAKVEEAKAAIKGLGGTNITVGFDIDQASLARAQAAAKAAFGTGVTVPVRFDTNAGAAALRGGAFGALGWLFGLAGRGVNLFGGVLPGILGSIGGLHLAIDLFAEFAAVVIPATIALVAFGVAAGPVVGDVVTQFKNLYTVTQATGKSIPPLTGGFHDLQDAAKPAVYGLLGDALTVVNSKFGEMQQLVKGTGDVLQYFGARAAVAITSSGMSAFLKNAVGDLSGFLNGIGNIFGTIGAVLRQLPGYAQTFLTVFQGITGAMERFANSGVGQGIIGFGLAFHGAFIYIGLLGTLVARVIPIVIGWLSKLAYSAAAASESLGFDSLAAGLFRFGGAAEVAAGISWGWVGIAAAAVGVLAYEITTAKTATQQWIATSQQAINNANAGNGFTAIARQQAAAAQQLALAQAKQDNTQIQVNKSVAAGGPGARYAIQYQQQLGQNTQNLSAYQSRLSVETNTYTGRLDALANKYGGTTIAQDLLTKAGVKMSQMLNVSAQAWKIIQQEVAAVSQGYAAMGQRSGILGADLFILNQQASDQYKAMQQLNQAWQTFITTMSSFQNSAITVIQTMRQMTAEGSKTGASFTGVNARSLTLQQTFEQTFIPQLQNVIQGMRQGGASAQSMSDVIATALKPAVDKGALANQGLRQQIYAMAREADPNATNTLSFLKHWVDQNAGSLRNMMQRVDGVSAALGRLPKNEYLRVYVHGVGQFVAPPGMAAGHMNARAKGGRIPGYGGGDIYPAMLEPGETVIPKHLTPAVAGFARYHRLPGFAGGGFVPDYRGSVQGLGPWATGDVNALDSMFRSTATQDFLRMMPSPIGGGAGGRTSAGGAYSRAMLERLWQQAGGPGGYIALIAAAIALAESGGNPNARNPSGASGLWQILGQVYPGNIFNPFTNALNAVSKYDSAHGFSPWVTYTTGAYRAFMDNGGWLQPGTTVVQNNTGKPEMVIPWDRLGGGDIVIQIDGREIARVSQAQARRYNRRNGPRGTDKWAKPA